MPEALTEAGWQAASLNIYSPKKKIEKVKSTAEKILTEQI